MLSDASEGVVGWDEAGNGYDRSRAVAGWRGGPTR